MWAHQNFFKPQAANDWLGDSQYVRPMNGGKIDESIWNKAKESARKIKDESSDGFESLVMKIYREMIGSEKLK